MNTEEEARAVDEVVDRLAARFPGVSRDHVAAVVGEEHLELEGNPIRDFIPVLVEHGARERLRVEGATPIRLAQPAPDVSSSAGPLAGGSQPETAFGSRIDLLNGDLGGATG